MKGSVMRMSMARPEGYLAVTVAETGEAWTGPADAIIRMIATNYLHPMEDSQYTLTIRSVVT